MVLGIRAHNGEIALNLPGKLTVSCRHEYFAVVHRDFQGICFFNARSVHPLFCRSLFQLPSVATIRGGRFTHPVRLFQGLLTDPGKHGRSLATKWFFY